MSLYEVSLSRTYAIKVEARLARDAAVLSELFMGHKDDSTPPEKKTFGFEVKEMNLATNDALEVNKVEN